MECGHLNGGKSKAVTYAFPPGYRENAEEEEEQRMCCRGTKTEWPHNTDDRLKQVIIRTHSTVFMFNDI
jgi:hypothetical protein